MRPGGPWRPSLAEVYVLNGVNLGALGSRRPEVYGTATLADIERAVRKSFPGVEIAFRQTDHEGEMVAWIREAGEARGIIINPGAWSHYSYAIHDALEAAERPAKVEVHLSNIHAREEWRRRSVISAAVDAVIAGMGPAGYRAAVAYVLGRL